MSVAARVSGVKAVTLGAMTDKRDPYSRLDRRESRHRSGALDEAHDDSMGEHACRKAAAFRDQLHGLPARD